MSNEIQFILYYCHKCKTRSYLLSSRGRCVCCKSGFIDETDAYDDCKADHEMEPMDWQPNSTTSLKQQSSNKSAENCSICLEVITDNLKKLICSHSFHKLCIDKWLKEHNSCPLCRNNVRSGVTGGHTSSNSSLNCRNPQTYVSCDWMPSTTQLPSRVTTVISTVMSNKIIIYSILTVLAIIVFFILIALIIYEIKFRQKFASLTPFTSESTSTASTTESY